MNGIDKIIERIERDMGAEIAVITEDAHKQAEAITAKYQAQAARERALMLERGQAVADERLQRLGGVAALEARKLELAAKQEAVSLAFKQAEEQLAQLPDDRYVALLGALAAAAAISGKEQIILSPRDHERFGAAVVAQANKQRAGGAFTLSPHTRPIQGGLLLSEGDIEINCTFDSIIRLLYGEMSSQVAKILFE